MRVVIDYDRCESNGVCMAFAPDIFELRDDDNLYLLIERPEESMRGQVDAAVSGCPKAAITVTED